MPMSPRLLRPKPAPPAAIQKLATEAGATLATESGDKIRTE